MGDELGLVARAVGRVEQRLRQEGRADFGRDVFRALAIRPPPQDHRDGCRPVRGAQVA